MTSICEQLKSLNRSLEKKYTLNAGDLDQYLNLRRFKSMTQYLFYIEPVLNPQAYDEYSIIRLENQYLNVSEQLEDIPEVADYLFSKYDKISTSVLYEDYITVIEKKLRKYARVSNMSTEPDLLDIDKYMKESPEFNWTTEINELFEPLIDPYILLLLNMFRHIIEHAVNILI